ncbi:MAG: hypothetical protein O7G88_22195 [bacterium]|nr:hypothetical protein [bacterium]
MEVEHAVKTLRIVNNIRVALQHSGAARELLAALNQLGISYPPRWIDAWSRVQAETAEALRVIRDKVLEYARESADEE